MFKAAKGDPIDSPPPYSKTADEAFERAKIRKLSKTCEPLAPPAVSFWGGHFS
jgi:hypothetical protein